MNTNASGNFLSPQSCASPFPDNVNDTQLQNGALWENYISAPSETSLFPAINAQNAVEISESLEIPSHFSGVNQLSVEKNPSPHLTEGHTDCMSLMLTQDLRTVDVGNVISETRKTASMLTGTPNQKTPEDLFLNSQENDDYSLAYIVSHGIRYCSRLKNGGDSNASGTLDGSANSPELNPKHPGLLRHAEKNGEKNDRTGRSTCKEWDPELLLMQCGPFFRDPSRNQGVRRKAEMLSKGKSIHHGASRENFLCQNWQGNSSMREMDENFNLAFSHLPPIEKHQKELIPSNKTCLLYENVNHFADQAFGKNPSSSFSKGYKNPNVQTTPPVPKFVGNKRGRKRNVTTTDSSKGIWPSNLSPKGHSPITSAAEKSSREHIIHDSPIKGLVTVANSIQNIDPNPIQEIDPKTCTENLQMDKPMFNLVDWPEDILMTTDRYGFDV